MSAPILVFTDLDGTLLNHDDYDWAPARPALEALKQRGVPLVLVSSKTDREMLALRTAMGNADPLVCENGSLILIPEPLLAELGIERDERSLSDGYHYSYRGLPREQILTVLNDLTSDYRFTGFAWMSPEDIARHTGLSLDTAVLASERKASEPIVWRDSDPALAEFTQVLGQQHLRVVKGGRFYHVMGQCDKGDAVRYLQSLYEHRFGARPYTVALGDSPNDLDMLKQVDAPVIVPHRDGSHLQDAALKRARVAPEPGAEGWNDAVLSILDRE